MSDFSILPFYHNSLQTANKRVAEEIIKCNKKTREHGLVLTEEQALRLAETRTDSLKDSGRIEFGSKSTSALICAFADSPYIIQDNYEQTLHELIRIFYDFKNETSDLLSDRQLINFMKKYFDSTCAGSTELLETRELTQLAMHLNNGGRLSSFKPDTEEM